MKADFEKKHREFLSYERFVRGVKRLREKGVIKEVIEEK
ncbi:hypothetical protein Arcpr_0566 [Archaeoglobus profundus DSM 5631]|uniref:Uncharacterized protein n=1 Tax=Archaeoglobus profundus (strain DSM 5631 / JCM 9629 / NBRC 100127 / Av18) TaxID=572546 RepID=D2RH56_ARCPA|nr:hypothetical protein Arcpr_0566 [Archaeoglobus profundus DSM 5631]